MGKFKEYLLTRKEEASKLKVEEAEMKLNQPTGIAKRVLGWADELQKVIDDNQFATNKWGPNLCDWDEEDQD